MGIDMAAKKSGGLGRSFSFILEDNMPINTESPMSVKKRASKKRQLKEKQSKLNIITNSKEDILRSDERIESNSFPSRTPDKIPEPIKTNIQQNSTEKSVDIGTSSSSNITLTISDDSTAKLDDAARKAAVASLRQKINATLKYDEANETSNNGEEEHAELREYHSRLVKLKYETNTERG